MKKEMFKDIIGYDKVKKSLERIIDVLNSKDKYKELGCVIPHGLLLYGESGLGKSTFAFDMINSVNRKSYVIRKNKSDGSFINYLNKAFEDAKNNQPSIILLDDIDKLEILANVLNKKKILFQDEIENIINTGNIDIIN